MTGNWPRAAFSAACTSRAAESMFRFRSNWSVMFVFPSPLPEVISVIPAMRPNWRSSGVATAVAITSGAAPGRLALTLIVGNSTCGTGATGRKKNAMPPTRPRANVSSDVATGLLMKGVEILMAAVSRGLRELHGFNPRNSRNLRLISLPPQCGKFAEEQIDTRRCVQGQNLANHEASDDRDTQRTTQFRTDAGSKRERHTAEHGRHGSHEDRPETKEAGLIDRLQRRFAVVPLGLKGEVDHHDRVLLDDSDQQNDSDQRNDAQINPADEKRENGACAGRRQRR